MDWKTYTLSLVDSLAWPAVLVVAIIVLRNPISNLIRTLRGVKATGFGSTIDMEFNEAIEAASLIETELAVNELENTDGSEGAFDDTSISGSDLTMIYGEHASLSLLVQEQPAEAIIRGEAHLERELKRLNVSEAEIEGVYTVSPHILGLIKVLSLLGTLAHSNRQFEVRHAAAFAGYLLTVVLALRSITPKK